MPGSVSRICASVSPKSTAAHAPLAKWLNEMVIPSQPIVIAQGSA
jgi:hypothetical protein